MLGVPCWQTSTEGAVVYTIFLWNFLFGLSSATCDMTIIGISFVLGAVACHLPAVLITLQW